MDEAKTIEHAPVHPRITDALRDARSYLTESDLHEMLAPKPWRAALALAFLWSVILLGIASGTLLPSAWVFALAFLAIAGAQHGLNNWVHEAAHISVSRNKNLNDLLSDIFAASPIFITTAGYREKHIRHHTSLGHPNLDTEIKARYLIRGGAIAWLSLKTFLGATALQIAQDYWLSGASKALRSTSPVRPILLIAATNGAISAYCFALGVPWAWFYLWLLPLATLTPYLACLRVIAEHQSDEYAKAGKEQYDCQLNPAITRTIKCGPIVGFFLAPMNFNFHFEHHTWPAIPFSQLPKAHALLRERGFYSQNPHLLGPSYAAVLMSLIRPRATGGDASVR